MGLSYTYNNATADSTNNAVSIIDVHARYKGNNIYAVAEFGNISYDQGAVENSNGFYIDLGYNIGALLKTETEIIPFVRITDYNTAASTQAGGDSEKQFHTSKWMIGASIKPISEVVFKADFSQIKNDLSKNITDQINFGVGYMF